MTDSKIYFSKEIANTIGLEEAILLEYLKQQEVSHDQVSMNKLELIINFGQRKTLEISYPS